MSITVKAGVEFGVIRPAGYCILGALRVTSRRLAVDLVITSGTDGTHSGPADPHARGEAFDVRSKTLTAEQREAVLASVMDQLGWSQFFGFLEDSGKPNEHLHFQRRKGHTYDFQKWLRA